MPVSKNAYKRYLIIHEMLNQKIKTYPTKQRLLNRLADNGYEITDSMLEKDLRAMRDKFSLPVAYDKRNEGYCYTEEDVKFDIPLSDNDVKTIWMAVNKLKLFSDTLAFRNVRSSLERIMTRLEIDLGSKAEDAEQYIFYEPQPDFAGSQWLVPAYDAICEREEISFTFNPMNERLDHVFEPYLLKEYSGRWYVIGKEKNEPSLYGLDRVQDLKTTGRKFIRDEKFSHFMKFNVYNSVGMLDFSARRHAIILLYDASLAWEVKNNKVHETQKIIGEDSHEICVLYRVNVNEEFVKHAILPYGDKVTVVDPPFLADLVLKIYLNSIRKYDSSEANFDRYWQFRSGKDDKKGS